METKPTITMGAVNQFWDIYSYLEQGHEFSIDGDEDQSLYYDWPAYNIPDSDIVLNREALQGIRQYLRQSMKPSYIRGSLADNINDGIDNALRNNKIDSVQSKGSVTTAINDNHNGGIPAMKSTKDPSAVTTTIARTTTITCSNNNTMTMVLVLCIVIWLGFQYKKHCSISAEKARQLPYYNNQQN